MQKEAEREEEQERQEEERFFQELNDESTDACVFDNEVTTGSSYQFEIDRMSEWPTTATTKNTETDEELEQQEAEKMDMWIKRMKATDDKDGDNTDDPGRGKDEEEKTRGEDEELQPIRGGGEDEETAPPTSTPRTTKPTIPTLSALIDALKLSKDKLFFISIPTDTDTNNGREWRLVRLNFFVSIMHTPSCLKTGKDFLCEFYRCHPADLQFNAIDQRYWLQYFTKADLIHPRQIADNHLIMTSNSSDAYAMENNLKNARNYIDVLLEDTFIHGPFNFATGQNQKTRDRIGQEDWQALANHSHMFQNSVPGHDAPTYPIQVDNGVQIICPGTHQDMFSHLFALQSDDESEFSEVEDTGTDSPEIDNGEEHNSKINGKEAEIKNNICTHTMGGRVEGEGKLGVKQHENQDDWHAEDAKKYKPTEEEGTEPPQSKRMRLDDGYGEIDYWSARKQCHQEIKKRYHEMHKAALTSENSTTVKYPGNQHNEEAGNLGEGTE